MWWMVWAGLAAAGELVVDARVPTEVHLDGHPAVELFTAGVVHLEVPAGRVAVTVYVNGKPQKSVVDVPASGAATLLVGRTGVTGSVVAEAAPAAAGPRSVEFRVTGDSGVTLQVDKARHKLSPGETLTLDLASGEHQVSVRDDSGTTIWARGRLQIGDGPIVVQLAEGRVPEVAGEGGAFRPDTN